MTYHPISSDEILQWYFQPLDDAECIDKLAKKFGFQAESFREFLAYGRDHLPLERDDLSGIVFEDSHGLMIASAQTFFVPYYPIRNGVYSELLDGRTRRLFEKYVSTLQEFVPRQYRSMRFCGQLGEEERSSGVYIPPDQVKRLLYDLQNDADVATTLLHVFDANGFLLFYSALRDAAGSERGLLEAVDVLFACEYDESNKDFGDETYQLVDDENRRQEIVAIFTKLGCVDELHDWPYERRKNRLTALDARQTMLVPTVTRREMPAETVAWFQRQLASNRKKLKPDKVKTTPGSHHPHCLKPDRTDLGYALAWFAVSAAFLWAGWNVWQGNWAANNWSDRLLPYMAVIIFPFQIYGGTKRLRAWLGQPHVEVEMDQESVVLGEDFRFSVLIDGPMDCKHLSVELVCESFRDITDSGVPPYRLKGPFFHYEYPISYQETVLLRDGEQKILENLVATVPKEFPYSTTMRGGHPFPWTMKWQIQWSIDVVVQWPNGAVRKRRFPFAVHPMEDGR